MRLQILFAVLPALLAGSLAKRVEPAPLILARKPETAIAGNYIVKLRDGSGVSALDDSLSILTKRPDHVYHHAFRGFASTLSTAAIEALREHPDVDYIEQDAEVSATAYVTQKGSQWGLARISHRDLGSTEYYYGSTAGAGTCVYVLDTGIEKSHRQFQGRAYQIKSFIPGQPNDGHGHGTHMAGIIGGVTYGVAKKTKLLGVKVLSNQGTGSISQIIAGLDFVIKDAPTHNCPKGMLVNMSLRTTLSYALNSAAAAVVESGLFIAAAAGNDVDDAINWSPGSEPTVCTVAASDKRDFFADFSNFGPSIDLIAPGTDIKSAWIHGSLKTLSGTSVASAHVSGLAAYIMGRLEYPGSPDPQALCTHIFNTASHGVILSLYDYTSDALVHNGNNRF